MMEMFVKVNSGEDDGVVFYDVVIFKIILMIWRWLVVVCMVGGNC
jgi:hypothetical protein